MRLLPGVDQVVFLQMSQLSEAFVTGLTFEGSLPTVDTKVNLRSEEESIQTLRFPEKQLVEWQDDINLIICQSVTAA